MNPSADQNHAEPDLLEALRNLNSPAHRQLVNRTRRNVMETAYRMRAERRAGRERLGVTLLVCGILAVVLTPALWSLTEEIFNGERLLDTSSLTFALLITMACTIAAVLMLHGSDRRGNRNTH